MSHSLSSHGLAASGLLSNHTLAGGALSNHSLVAGALLPAEIAASCNIQSRVHLLPPASSFPSFSSTSSTSSSSPSSSSPIVNGSSSGGNNSTTTTTTTATNKPATNNNNNNDVILTGIYSLNSVPRSRPRPAAPQPQPDPAHTSLSIVSQQPLQSRSTSTSSTSSTSSTLHSKLLSHSQSVPAHTSGPLVHTAARKGAPSLVDAGISVGAGIIPHSWARQFAAEQTHPGSSSSSHAQLQPQPRPHSNPQPEPHAPQKTWLPLPVQNSGPALDRRTPRIQQVFTLLERGEADKAKPNAGSATEKGQHAGRRLVPHPVEASHNLSIAMETGDEEDEWQREEELANMAAQAHIHREQKLGGLTAADRGGHTPPATSSRPTTLQGSYTLTAQTSLTGESSSQVGGVTPVCWPVVGRLAKKSSTLSLHLCFQTSVSMYASPWVISNSRKRTVSTAFFVINLCTDCTLFLDGEAPGSASMNFGCLNSGVFPAAGSDPVQ